MILIFFFGLPPNISPDGAVNIIMEKNDPAEARKATIYKVISFIALFLVLAGFTLQLIATF